MVDYYFDENFCDWSVVNPLRARGLDVVTALDANLIGVPDEEQFAFAIRSRRVIVTTDEADFARLSTILLRSGGQHHGVIVARRRGVSVGELIEALAAIGELEPGYLVDRVEYLNNWIRSQRPG